MTLDCIIFAAHFPEQDVRRQLDTRVILRVPHEVLRQRRDERHGYHTAGNSHSYSVRSRS